LEVKEGKTSDNETVVKYIDVRGKPGFWVRIAERILTFFGRSTSWSLETVATTLSSILPDSKKLDLDQKNALKVLLQKISAFNLHHNKKITQETIGKLSSLVQEQPIAQSTFTKEQTSLSLPSKESSSEVRVSVLPGTNAKMLQDVHKNRARNTKHRPPTKGQALTKDHVEKMTPPSVPQTGTAVLPKQPSVSPTEAAVLPKQHSSTTKPFGGVGLGVTSELQQKLQQRNKTNP
jgi:hypothetical protein